ncbi:phosphotransferase family protein [Cohnella phaseoli]|uniref:Aminoglycoside phosphotransferase (APT) family kinase protein n=1 Tax=Cohnella phaseoli TaxID=456490 RepID=A0A3D9HZU0_9BACL|nr:phosphotransferase [Cohnella phaseoli]RED55017.1 aminoglycoside phosphotransferase (APT) family kinase protein [Cohnella phaseoli]
MREALQTVAEHIISNARLLRWRELKGGVSAQVIGLELELGDGSLRKIIIRRHGATDLARDPDIARHEFQLLGLLHSAGLAVPAPIFAEASSDLLGSPYIAIEFIESQGEVDRMAIPDFLGQLAAHLFAIHQAELPLTELSFLSQQADAVSAKLAARPAQLDASLSEGRIREALDSVWPLPQANRSVLLHGDYWPGNTLWRGGKLAAVIDWEDVAIGDPLADVGNARLEVLWAYGPEAMEEFTQHYRSLAKGTGFSQLPYWDLYAALRPASQLSRWGLEPSVERTMRERHLSFVDRALAELR